MARFEVLIVRSGTLIEVTGPEGSVLNLDLIPGVLDRLAFIRKTFLRGHDAYMVDGSKRTMDFTRVNMYRLTACGFTTGFGMLTKVCKLLQQVGADVRYIDLSRPRVRPDCFVTDWDSVNRYMQFRPRQRECLELLTANECGLIVAPPGFGKSTLFGAICHLYPNAKIHIVIPIKDVVNKLVPKLMETIPDVGLVTGESDRIGRRVTVFTAGSMHKTDGDADILLCDEVHEMMTDFQTTKISHGWRHTRNFAFTATPDGRLDGADAQVELFFGPQIFHMSYKEAQDLGLVVPIHVRWVDVNLPENPGLNKTEVHKTRACIWRNDARHRIIAEDVRTNYPDTNTQILMLTETTEHAIRLWQHLPEFDICYADMSDEDLAYYQKNGLLPDSYIPVSPVTRNQKRMAFQSGALKRVIATDVWSTGVDFEKLQVLYRVCGRASKIMDTQAPGRVSRQHEASGKSHGEVIDFLDRFDSSFKAKSEKRRKHYQDLGWTQQWPVRRGLG